MTSHHHQLYSGGGTNNNGRHEQKERRRSNSVNVPTSSSGGRGGGGMGSSSNTVTALKLVIVGDLKCGKTSLVHRLVDDEFLEEYSPTGFKTYRTELDVMNGRKMALTVWDTSGSPGFDAVRPLAYVDADVFLLCFDVGEPDSLDNIKTKWHSEVCAASAAARPTPPLVVVGCKKDLRTDIDAIAALVTDRKSPTTYEEGVALAETIGASLYVECSSSLDSPSVTDVFHASILSALGKLTKQQYTIRRQRSLLKKRSSSRPDLSQLRHKAKTCRIM